MRRSIFAVLAACAVFGSGSSAMAEGDADQRKAESLTIIKAFAGELKGELKGAMKSGGPLEAIAVCNEKAPSIAARQATQAAGRLGGQALNTAIQAMPRMNGRQMPCIPSNSVKPRARISS